MARFVITATLIVAAGVDLYLNHLGVAAVFAAAATAVWLLYR